MTDYISREAAIYALHDSDNITIKGIQILRNLPAADVREVKKGRWVECAYATTYDICGLNKKVGWGCSECGWTWDARTHFCPNCGADMREKQT